MTANPLTAVLSTAASTAGVMILDGFPPYVYLDLNKKTESVACIYTAEQLRHPVYVLVHAMSGKCGVEGPLA